MHTAQYFTARQKMDYDYTFEVKKKILQSLENELRCHNCHSLPTPDSPNRYIDKEPFIYYVTTLLGFLDPHVFSTKNKQKLAFSDPPPPYKCLRNI